MNGMDMMLKSMGINKEELQKNISNFGNIVIDLKTQMDRIEARQNIIESKLDLILVHLIPIEQSKEIDHV